jgi:hypothetical protein
MEIEKPLLVTGYSLIVPALKSMTKGMALQ